MWWNPYYYKCRFLNPAEYFICMGRYPAPPKNKSEIQTAGVFSPASKQSKWPKDSMWYLLIHSKWCFFSWNPWNEEENHPSNLKLMWIKSMFFLGWMSQTMLGEKIAWHSQNWKLFKLGEKFIAFSRGIFIVHSRWRA